MIRRKTCLVLGAGASMDVGFPSGQRLFDIVCDVTESTSPIYPLLLSLTKSQTVIEEFRNALMKSGRVSIDEFLQHNEKYLFIGKICIGAALIPFENETLLFKNGITGQNWYKLLFNRMSEDCTKPEDFSQNQITFITLNYDRSLEQFLFLSLCNSFDIQYDRAISILKSIKIIHLHGAIGLPTCVNLTAQSEVDNDVYDNESGLIEGEDYYRNYSHTISEFVLKRSAAGLRIIHDQQNEAIFSQAVDELMSSKLVCLLGMSYNKITLERMKVSSIPNPIIVGGTTMGLKLIELKRIETSLGGKRSIGLFKNCTIEDYFREVIELK